MKNAWGRIFEPARMAEVAALCRAVRRCTSCGGTGIVPAWAGHFRRWVQWWMPEFGEPGGFSPTPCPACSARAASLVPPEGDDCAACGGDGLLPEWAARAIATSDPRWTMSELHEGSRWYPEPCPACGGWGKTPGSVGATKAPVLVSQVGGSGATKATFSHAGRSWVVDFQGQIYGDGSKGLGYIAQLLAQPHTPMNAIDLVLAPTIGDGQVDGEEERLTARNLGNAGPVLDAKVYAAAAENLREKIELERSPERAVELKQQLKQVEDLLRHGTGLGGRDRLVADNTNRARNAVSKAINDAIERMRKHHPALATHLDLVIETGGTCTYIPDPRVEWEVILE